jgi:hypothetical protein
MRTPQKIAISVLALTLVAGGVYRLRKQPSAPIRRADGGEPLKTAEQILQERANQAALQLQTPVGKAFASRNWAEFKSLYQPQTQFHLLADIIRAHYIQNQFSHFTTEDMDEVLHATYDTLEQIEPKNRGQAGLLITQFYRLPLPQKQSSRYQQLESWLSRNGKDDPFLNRLAITKLVTQDMRPPEKAVKSFIAGYTNPYGADPAEWVRMTDDIRSVSVRERCLKELFRTYPSLKGDARAKALVVLGHEPALNGKAVAKLALDSLASEDQAAFEAGLRTIPGLLSGKLLNPDQKSVVVKRLTGLPEKLKTPYVTAKIGELLPQLSPPR